MASKKNEPATREDWERLHTRLEVLSKALERLEVLSEALEKLELENEKLAVENEQMKRQLTDWSSYN